MDEMSTLRRVMPVKMEERDTSYMFTAEMPGLGPDDVKVRGVLSALWSFIA